jgi:hypothetical protein
MYSQIRQARLHLKRRPQTLATQVQPRGAYSFAAQSGISRSGGFRPLYIIPQGNALCVAASGASASFAGSLSYTQD